MIFQFSKWVRRGFSNPAFWLLAIGVSVAIITNFSSDTNWTGESGFAKESLTSRPLPRTNLTEGTPLPEMLGIFRRIDGRFSFMELQGERRQYVCLENLALERVQQVAQEESSDCAWIITGQVTEFRGNNFLLIDSATPAPKRTIALR